MDEVPDAHGDTHQDRRRDAHLQDKPAQGLEIQYAPVLVHLQGRVTD
jgi:hypothetical protein